MEQVNSIGSIKDIAILRKKQGLTQKQLAKQAGVSQSLIAKIESGRIDPAYSNVIKIFDTLHQISEESLAKAKDLMTKNVRSVTPDKDISYAIKSMKKYGISQLPVICSGNLCGVVSESDILQAFIEKNKAQTVAHIMHEEPPTINSNASIEAVSNILRFYSLIVVTNKGKICGVITRSDVLKEVHNSK